MKDIVGKMKKDQETEKPSADEDSLKSNKRTETMAPDPQEAQGQRQGEKPEL